MHPVLLLTAALALDARAQETPTALGPHGYAVLVGSNRPGPGQEELQWAVADAERVASVFTELGGLPAERVLVLADPDPAEVLAAIDRVQDAIEAHAEADERSGLLFYYSGHARAQGLDLGGEVLPLSDLRSRLDGVPATVRVVVLDACQSGAVSDVKGATPAAAFSTASVAGLDAEGLAVIASSTATELSQESPELQGGFFTHHLLVGLRGAADGDGDGTVTLDEAYAYAYDRTVITTATTAIGRQHPTLETALRGRGGVALTRPGAGAARLRFGEDDRGAILMVHGPSGSVVAEVDKAAGDALTLAMPAGVYEIVWRRDDSVQRCRQDLAWGRTQAFAPRDCAEIVAMAAEAKGDAGPALLELVGIEAALGGLHRTSEDAYTGRLDDFGYNRDLDIELVGVLQGTLSLHRYAALVASYGGLESRSYSREIDSIDGADNTTRFRWTSHRAGLLARGQLPVLDGWLVPYAQAGGGLAWARTEFDEGEEPAVQRFASWQLSGGLGLQLMPAFGPDRWRHLGLYAQWELVTAPVLDNLLDETRDTGGRITTVGLRVAL